MNLHLEETVIAAALSVSISVQRYNPSLSSYAPLIEPIKKTKRYGPCPECGVDGLHKYCCGVGVAEIAEYHCQADGLEVIKAVLTDYCPAQDCERRAADFTDDRSRHWQMVAAEIRRIFKEQKDAQ